MVEQQHGTQESASTFDNAERTVGLLERIFDMIQKHKGLVASIISGGFLTGSGFIYKQHQEIKELKAETTVNVKVENAGDFVPETNRLNDELIKLRRQLNDLSKDYYATKERFH